MMEFCPVSKLKFLTGRKRKKFKREMNFLPDFINKIVMKPWVRSWYKGKKFCSWNDDMRIYSPIKWVVRFSFTVIVSNNTEMSHFSHLFLLAHSSIFLPFSYGSWWHAQIPRALRGIILVCQMILKAKKGILCFTILGQKTFILKMTKEWGN